MRVLYVFLYSSFHLVFLLRQSVHDSITLCSWPSWVCRVSNAHGGCDVYPTLASILFCSGCATYPMLVVGVTCTLSSRSFLFSPSCYFPAKFNVSISFAVVFLQLFEPRHPFLSIGCRSSSSLSSFLSMSPRYRHCLSNVSPPAPCSHPLSGFMAPLGFSVFLSRLPSPLLFCFLSHPLPGATWFSQHHRLFLSQHFFLRSRYPVSLQPNLLLRS